MFNLHIVLFNFAFSALTLLMGRQNRHPACNSKNVFLGQWKIALKMWNSVIMELACPCRYY